MPLRTQVFAHRGARAVAPENTLPAFARALELGADGIELDVQCSADGHLVVMHDFAVDKTTDGTGQVAALTLAELRRLDAGHAFGPAFAGVRVPTLEEVLDLVGNRCRLNIEIKSMDVQGGAEAAPSRCPGTGTQPVRPGDCVILQPDHADQAALVGAKARTRLAL